MSEHLLPEAVDRSLRQLAFLLFLGVLFAWVLGALGLNKPYIERIAISVISEFVAIYVIAEGTHFAFERCFSVPDDDEHEDDEELERMPEAEQIANA